MFKKPSVSIIQVYSTYEIPINFLDAYLASYTRPIENGAGKKVV